MPICATCGNDYDKTFEVIKDGTRHTYDSFECAIQALAPHCAACQCRIIGHGVEVGGNYYCCAHCAEQAGHSAITDRA